MYKIEVLSPNQKRLDLLIVKLNYATGVRFEYYRRAFLEKRVNSRMNSLKLKTIESYINYIVAHPEEINLFLNKFTINYTYFFRNYEIFERLKEIVKDFKMGMGTYKPIKIWSCPCATGEEPYSIAMLFEHLKKEDPNFPEYEIVASDIDKNAIEIARNGIYQEYSLYDTPEIYKLKYFTKKNGKYILNKEIKEKVEFIVEDITKGHKRPQNYDIVLCRNLIIYINRTALKRILQILNEHLKHEGILILGKTETLMEPNRYYKAFDPVNHFYVKNDFNLSKIIQKEKEIPVEPPKTLEKVKPIKIKKVKPISKKKITPAKIKKVVPKKIERLKPVKKEKIIPAKIRKPIPEKKEKIIPKARKREKHEDRIKVIPAEVKVDQQIVPEIKVKVEKIDLEQQENLVEQREKLLEIRERRLERQIKELAKQLNIIELRERQLELKEQELELREKNVEQREILYEEQERFLAIQKKLEEKRVKKVGHQMRKMGQWEKQIKRREKQIEKRMEHAEVLINQIEQHEKQVKLRERQIELELRTLQEDQKKEQEKQPVEQEYRRVERKTDRIVKPNIKGELALPIGCYALIDLGNKDSKVFKISIYELEYSLALILKDDINGIYAMSHCLLPGSKIPPDFGNLNSPHKYIDSSVRDLLNKMLTHGAKKANIRAIIFGGKVYSGDAPSIEKSLSIFKKELELLQIKIEKEDIGGLSGRSIIFDVMDNSLFIKKTWEEYFRRISL